MWYTIDTPVVNTWNTCDIHIEYSMNTVAVQLVVIVVIHLCVNCGMKSYVPFHQIRSWFVRVLYVQSVPILYVSYMQVLHSLTCCQMCNQIVVTHVSYVQSVRLYVIYAIGASIHTSNVQNIVQQVHIHRCVICATSVCPYMCHMCKVFSICVSSVHSEYIKHCCSLYCDLPAVNTRTCAYLHQYTREQATIL